MGRCFGQVVGLLVAIVLFASVWQQIDAQACVAVGGFGSGLSNDHDVAFRTVDGGDSWALTFTSDNNSFYGVDCTLGYFCVGAGSHFLPGVLPDGQLAWSNDTGESWSWGLTNDSQAQQLHSISCASSTCVATGFEHPVGISVATYFFYVTQNAGGSWRVVYPQIPHVVNLALIDVSCPTPLICFAAAIYNSSDLFVLKSTDGGLSWSALAGSIAPGITGTAQFIECPSSASCTFAGYCGNGNQCSGWIGQTSDGGSTWNYTLFEPGPALGFSGVACPSEEVCFLPMPFYNATAYYLQMVSTSDGGKHWSISVPTVWTAPGEIGGFACPTPNTCFLGSGGSGGVGDVWNASISRTLDGWSTWTTTVFDTSAEITGISCDTLWNSSSATSTTSQPTTTFVTSSTSGSPHNGNAHKLPLWAIIVIAVGGALLLAVIAGAVVLALVLLRHRGARGDYGVHPAASL